MDPAFLAPLIPIVAIIAVAAVKIARLRAPPPESPSADVSARLEALPVISPFKESLMSHFTPLAVAALLLWSAACQPAPKTETATMGGASEAVPGGLSASEEAAIRAVHTEWSRAASAGDGNAIAALYATDATVLPPMEPIRQSEAAKKYWVDFTNTFAGPIELKTTVVEGRGDLAYTSGTYRMTLTPKKAGSKALPPEEGKYVTVVKKQGDGSWKITYDIWNPNGPAASQEPGSIG